MLKSSRSLSALLPVSRNRYDSRAETIWVSEAVESDVFGIGFPFEFVYGMKKESVRVLGECMPNKDIPGVECANTRGKDMP